VSTYVVGLPVATVVSNLITGKTNCNKLIKIYSYTSSHKITILEHASHGLSAVAELLVNSHMITTMISFLECCVRTLTDFYYFYYLPYIVVTAVCRSLIKDDDEIHVLVYFQNDGRRHLKFYRKLDLRLQ